MIIIKRILFFFLDTNFILKQLEKKKKKIKINRIQISNLRFILEIDSFFFFS